MTALLFIHFSLSLEHHIKFEMATFVINRNREHVNSQLWICLFFSSLFKILRMTSWHFLMAERSCPQPWQSPTYPSIPSSSVAFPLYRDWETVCLGSFFLLIFKLVHWEICTMYFDHINSLLHSFQIQSSSWPIQLGSLSIILTYQHSCCCSNAPRWAVSHWSMIIPPEAVPLKKTASPPGSYHCQ